MTVEFNCKCGWSGTDVAVRIEGSLNDLIFRCGGCKSEVGRMVTAESET